MKFCAIGPLAVREIFQEHSHHMMLAQYLYDIDYRTFYIDLIGQNKTVILDSGVYEGSAVDDRQLLYWCTKLMPTAVVLPDAPHDANETLKRSLRFTQLLDDAKCPVKKWKVLHAHEGSLTQFTQSYIYDSRLFDGVCFSRLTSDYGCSTERVYQRRSFIDYLKHQVLWNANCYHHALGMADGSTTELKELVTAGIDSCDSSAPIWRPLNQGYGLPLRPTPFGVKFDPFALAPFKYIDTAVKSFKDVNNICES